ncbi:GNAT family N-acetyltransferase [Fictibacillus fluitans]|uniref:GNAT family N-acetyltransferase n=1 Tax=Fictibacillus fluitans TaxID=3058422 RepID=A0ABT8HYY6_9BACL|nr:GNAT family N-acetyltransferase [Fictibacillus sp. NE201]MDN4525990.1 GNAT family N-acetyltransferase [Fictibacillus sp. NE201]
MAIEYFHFDTYPDTKTVEGITHLHNDIFGSSDDLAGRMKEKPDLKMEVAVYGEKIIGYKIGYALNREQFYSWLGGVKANYRNHGIASKLMKQQHQYLKASGYKAVQTKTKNKWRSMLILNIKSGFDIIGTYTDGEGEPKIILEKKLVE